MVEIAGAGGEGKRVRATIPGNSTVVVDQSDLTAPTALKAVKYFLSAFNTSQDKTKYQEIAIILESSGLRSSTGFIVNNGLGINVNPKINAGKLDFEIENTHSFLVKVNLVRIEFRE